MSSRPTCDDDGVDVATTARIHPGTHAPTGGQFSTGVDNIKSWFALMMHRKSDRHDYIRMEFRRFLNTIVLIPAMVTRRSRGITIRLIGYTPAIDRLLSVWATTERTRFG
jgi:hypothetical protein